MPDLAKLSYFDPSINKFVQKEIAIPAYGEVKLICHDGKIKFIETTVKEKVE